MNISLGLYKIKISASWRVLTGKQIEEKKEVIKFLIKPSQIEIEMLILGVKYIVESVS